MNRKDPKNLGPETEDAVEEATRELIKEDNHFIGYIRAKCGDRLDSNGVDILIFLLGGLALPLQVKSTYRGIHNFHKKHPQVKYVLVVRGLATDKNSSRYRRAIIYIKKQIVKFSSRAVFGTNKNFDDKNQA